MKGTSQHFFFPQKCSYFVQRNRIDLFEENSTGNFDAKICSNISMKFAFKKVGLNNFMSAYSL